jgi:hypothetical protein
MSLIDTNYTLISPISNKEINVPVYKNNQLNRWYDTVDVSEIIKNMNQINLTEKRERLLNNENYDPLSRYHDNSTVPSNSTTDKKTLSREEFYLSEDNIRLMDACDFYGGQNPITNKTCIESFISKLENEYIENEQNNKNELSLDDKIYLTICSAGFVYLLFKFSNKYNL